MFLKIVFYTVIVVILWAIAELLFELTLYLPTFQACGNKLLQHGCNSEEAVTGMKDNQLGRVLERIGSTLADWDSCKCPPMKAHIDRMKTKEGAAVKGCSPSSAIVREEFHEPESTSQFMDLDFAFIGGVIVATGIVLAKPFVLAFF